MKEYLIKLLIAVICGGIIGFEREYKNKSSGIKTSIFICIGATLFTHLSILIGGDIGRLIAPIITGIGFIGAGAIIKDGNKVSGLTTASLVWVTAGLGIAIGLNYELLAILTAAITVVLSFGLSKLERFLFSKNRL